jgi:hypothetical protein
LQQLSVVFPLLTHKLSSSSLGLTSFHHYALLFFASSDTSAYFQHAVSQLITQNAVGSVYSACQLGKYSAL